MSEVPFHSTIAAVRVARIDGELTINPTPEQLEESDLEFIVAGHRGSIVMVEGGANQVPEADVLAALKFGHESLLPVIDTIEDLQKKVGQEKIVSGDAEDLSDLWTEIRGKCEDRLAEAFQIKEKFVRSSAVKAIEKEVLKGYVDEYSSCPLSTSDAPHASLR